MPSSRSTWASPAARTARVAPTSRPARTPRATQRARTVTGRTARTFQRAHARRTGPRAKEARRSAPARQTAAPPRWSPPLQASTRLRTTPRGPRRRASARVVPPRSPSPRWRRLSTTGNLSRSRRRHPASALHPVLPDRAVQCRPLRIRRVLPRPERRGPAPRPPAATSGIAPSAIAGAVESEHG